MHQLMQYAEGLSRRARKVAQVSNVVNILHLPFIVKSLHKVVVYSRHMNKGE